MTLLHGKKVKWVIYSLLGMVIVQLSRRKLESQKRKCTKLRTIQPGLEWDWSSQTMGLQDNKPCTVRAVPSLVCTMSISVFGGQNPTKKE